MSGAAEDAAVLLADFVSSLDNLPSEVCHILEEIGHKEGRVSDLRARASQRDQNIQKHAKPASAGGQGLLVPNPKEEATVQKIRSVPSVRTPTGENTPAKRKFKLQGGPRESRGNH